MKRIAAAIALLALSACPMPGETWGPCDPYTNGCEGDLWCSGGTLDGDVLGICVPPNESADPFACPDAVIADNVLASQGFDYCQIPCADSSDCDPDIGLMCSVTHWCAWSVGG